MVVAVALLLRTEERKGAGLEFTWRLAGLRREWTFLVAILAGFEATAGAGVGGGNRESFTDEVRRGFRFKVEGEVMFIDFTTGESSPFACFGLLPTSYALIVVSTFRGRAKGFVIECLKVVDSEVWRGLNLGSLCLASVPVVVFGVGVLARLRIRGFRIVGRSVTMDSGRESSSSTNLIWSQNSRVDLGEVMGLLKRLVDALKNVDFGWSKCAGIADLILKGKCLRACPPVEAASQSGPDMGESRGVALLLSSDLVSITGTFCLEDDEASRNDDVLLLCCDAGSGTLTFSPSSGVAFGSEGVVVLPASEPEATGR